MKAYYYLLIFLFLLSSYSCSGDSRRLPTRNIPTGYYDDYFRNEFNDKKEYQDYYLKGILFYKNENYQHSNEFFRKASKINRVIDPDLYFHYGNSFFKLKQYKNARIEYKYALKYHYKTPKFLYYNMACVESNLHNFKEALKYLELSIKSGFHDFQWILDDNDLTYLKSKSKWESIFMDLKNKYSNKGPTDG